MGKISVMYLWLVTLLASLSLPATAQSKGDVSGDWKIVSAVMVSADAKFAAECATEPCPKDESSALHLARKAAYATARELLESFDKKWESDPTTATSLRQSYRLGYLSEKQEDFAAAHSYYSACLAHKLIESGLTMPVDGNAVPIKMLCSDGQVRMECLVRECSAMPSGTWPGLPATEVPGFGGGMVQMVPGMGFGGGTIQGGPDIMTGFGGGTVKMPPSGSPYVFQRNHMTPEAESELRRSIIRQMQSK